MKKAQITLYIIVGMILLVAFGFLIYIYSLTNTTDLSRNTIQKTHLNSFALKQYAQTCLEQSFDEALSLLLSQGGYIYNNQEGSVLNCVSENCTDLSAIFYESRKIGYNQISNTIDIKEKNNLSVSHNFPCNKDDINCKFVYGINRPCTYDASQKCPLPISPLLMNSFLTNLSIGDSSWTKQIQNFINVKTNDCLNFETAEWLPYNIKKGEISSQLILGVNDVSIKAKVPLEIMGSQEFLTQDFNLNYPIRLKALYDFIKALIYKDSSEPDFNLGEDYNKLPQYIDGINVQVLKSVYNNEDIVVVSDSKSHFSGNSISYKFARHNIPPFLNYFSINPSSNYDVEIQWNQDLILSPQAFDANEDDIIYTYSGWASERFMSSSMFQSTQKDAKIFLDITDVGEHEITIKVSDGEKEDWQNVKVRVTG